MSIIDKFIKVNHMADAATSISAHISFSDMSDPSIQKFLFWHNIVDLSKREKKLKIQ